MPAQARRRVRPRDPRGRRPPPGRGSRGERGAALLAYLPEAPDDGARDEAAAVLASPHHKRKEPLAAVLDALKDGEACRRAAAARALGPAHAADHLGALKRLAGDADDEV